VLGLPLQQLKRHPWLVDYQHGEAAIRALSKTLELPELSNFGTPPAEPGVYLREISGAVSPITYIGDIYVTK